MDEILRIAGEHGVPVIEDNAHGLFGRYKGRALGSFGAFSTLSFHETKNISCGEGGALVINEPKYVERAEILREKGTNRSAFFRGQVDKYTWVDVGSSYLPSEILAAFLCAQLGARGHPEPAPQGLGDLPPAASDWAEQREVRLPHVPAHCDQPHHMFYLVMPSLEQRTAFIAHMKARGIMAVFHYLPLHLSPMGKRFGGRPGDCPVTEDVSDRLVRLPLYVGLSESEQEVVLDAIHAFSGRGEASVEPCRSSFSPTCAIAPRTLISIRRSSAGSGTWRITISGTRRGTGGSCARYAPAGCVHRRRSSRSAAAPARPLAPCTRAAIG